MITKDTARQIWSCHNEIDKANNLIQIMKESIAKHGDLLIPDTFGERQGISMNIPNSENSSRVYNVPPELTIKVIDAHVGYQQKRLAELMVLAEVELREKPHG